VGADQLENAALKLRICAGYDTGRAKLAEQCGAEDGRLARFIADGADTKIAIGGPRAL
jgi:hypothetical protein